MAHRCVGGPGSIYLVQSACKGGVGAVRCGLSVRYVMPPGAEQGLAVPPHCCPLPRFSCISAAALPCLPCRLLPWPLLIIPRCSWPSCVGGLQRKLGKVSRLPTMTTPTGPFCLLRRRIQVSPLGLLSCTASLSCPSSGAIGLISTPVASSGSWPTVFLSDVGLASFRR